MSMNELHWYSLWSILKKSLKIDSIKVRYRGMKANKRNHWAKVGKGPMSSHSRNQVPSTWGTVAMKLRSKSACSLMMGPTREIPSSWPGWILAQLSLQCLCGCSVLILLRPIIIPHKTPRITKIIQEQSKAYKIYQNLTSKTHTSCAVKGLIFQFLDLDSSRTFMEWHPYHVTMWYMTARYVKYWYCFL